MFFEIGYCGKWWLGWVLVVEIGKVGWFDIGCVGGELMMLDVVLRESCFFCWWGDEEESGRGIGGVLMDIEFENMIK